MTVLAATTLTEIEKAFSSVCVCVFVPILELNF
jgi:hypothetical protein